MLKLNIQNVEDIVFSDKDLRKKLPELNHLFVTWDMSKMSFAMRHIGKRACLDFLSQVNPEQIEIISQHINFSLSVDVLDSKLVKNIDSTIDKVSEELEEAGNYNIAAYREGEQVYLSLWK